MCLHYIMDTRKRFPMQHVFLVWLWQMFPQAPWLIRNNMKESDQFEYLWVKFKIYKFKKMSHGQRNY